MMALNNLDLHQNELVNQLTCSRVYNDQIATKFNLATSKTLKVAHSPNQSKT